MDLSGTQAAHATPLQPVIPLPRLSIYTVAACFILTSGSDKELLDEVGTAS